MHFKHHSRAPALISTSGFVLHGSSGATKGVGLNFPPALFLATAFAAIAAAIVPFCLQCYTFVFIFYTCCHCAFFVIFPFIFNPPSCLFVYFFILLFSLFIPAAIVPFFFLPFLLLYLTRHHAFLFSFLSFFILATTVLFLFCHFYLNHHIVTWQMFIKRLISTFHGYSA